jgi:hypothetical protein
MRILGLPGPLEGSVNRVGSGLKEVSFDKGISISLDEEYYFYWTLKIMSTSYNLQ